MDIHDIAELNTIRQQEYIKATARDMMFGSVCASCGHLYGEQDGDEVYPICRFNHEYIEPGTKIEFCPVYKNEA